MPTTEDQNIYFDNIEAVKQAELKYVASRRAKAGEECGGESDLPVKSVFAEEDSSKRGLVGLAFSGGGIRSASFNLGVMQALSKYDILPWVDYLSTVSGGGYIGAALISLLGWKKNDAQFHFNTQWENFPFNPEKEVIKNKMHMESKGGSDKENRHAEPVPGSTEYISYDGAGALKDGNNRPLHYLVEKGNFLTPRGGYVTRDILRLIGYLTGGIGTMLFLYLLLIVTLALCGYIFAYSLPEFSREQGVARIFCIYEEKVGETGEVVSNVAGCTDLKYTEVLKKRQLWNAITTGSVEKDVSTSIFTSFYLPLLIIGGAFAILVAFSMIFINSPYLWRRDNKNPYDTALRNLKWVGGIWLLSLTVCSTLLGGQYLRKSGITWESIQWLVTLSLTLAVALFYWFGIVSNRKATTWQEQSLEKDNVLDYLTIEFFSILFAVTMVLAFGFHRISLVGNTSYYLHIFFLPLTIVAGSFVGIFLVRLAADLFLQTTKNPEDSGRLTPWSSPRFRSIYSSWMGSNIYALLLSAGFALLMIPQFFVSPAGNVKEVVPLSSALISSIWAAVMLYLRSNGEKSGGSFKTLFNLPEGVWQGLFGVMVIVLNYSLLFIVESVVASMLTPELSAVVWFAGALVLFLVLTWIINPNEISPHYFYRDRIDDAFLRTETFSANGRRLVARDDSLLAMQDVNPDGCSAPYHLVIGAINLSGSWVLDYKDRKSDHFLFSKFFTGSDVTGYVCTDKYRTAFGTTGITKYSRAIAISGAAFSSSIGVMSFLAASFLLTILNIRLGLWMVNPNKYMGRKRNDTTRDPLLDYELHYLFGRFFTPGWLIYLWDEARNRVSERRDLVNLSDGGHTGDNAGLYPLLQRRCKLIIAGDASADPSGECVDLYRVIRMARSDLGIDIHINTNDLKPDKETGLSNKHVVVGRIDYPKTEKGDEETGWLVYIKPTITKDDRGEIRQYYDTHKNWYPHPTTGDQWFDEWQFEAQRLLGEEAVKSALAEWSKTLNPKARLSTNPLKVTRKIFWKGAKTKVSFNSTLDKTFGRLCK